MSDMQDNELISRLLTGEDDRAWELFIRKYSRLIWSSIHKTSYALAASSAREDAEDVFSSIVLSLLEDDFRKLRQFEARNACSLSTWLAVVSVNHTINCLRKNKNLIQSSIDETDLAAEIIDTRPGIESALIEKQQEGALAEVVARLPEQDRALYELLFAKDHTPEKAAKALDISLPALYTRKNRLLEKIRNIMQDV